MTRSKVFLSIILLFAGLPGILAQEDLRFHHLGVEDGLSHSSVLEIFRDSKGFMWFGTRTGLNRFDGVTMDNFLQDPDDPISIIFGFVSCIVEDYNTDLWIGSKGLYYYDRSMESFSRFFHDPEIPTSLGSNAIRDLEIDSVSRLWICHTRGIDLYNRAENTFVHVRDSIRIGPEIDTEKIFDIEVDNSGRIWFCTNTDLYLLDWDNRRIRKYVIPFQYAINDGLNEETILKSSRSGRLWLAGLNGQVFYYSEEEDMVVLSGITVPTGNPINSIEEDSEGNILIGTNFGGLFVFDLKSGEIYQYRNEPTDPYSLSNNQVYSIFTDDSDMVWIGNWEGGINFTNPYGKIFDWIKHNPEDEDNQDKDKDYVLCICNDGGSNLLIGSWNGISCWDLNEERFCDFNSAYDREGLLNGAVVNCLVEAEEGRIWAGTAYPGGVYVIDAKNGRTDPLHLSWDTRDIIGKSNILSIDRDDKGMLWLGTNNGIYRLDLENQSISSYNTANSALRSNGIINTYIDSRGGFWAGSSVGLYLYKPEDDDFLHIAPYIRDSDYSSNWVYSIFEDHLGQFWIGTAGYGLILYNRDSGDFTSYTVKNGLSSNVITGIEEDNNGSLWISSYKGISEFDPDTKTVFNNYGFSDGILNIEFRSGSHVKTEEGMIAFGGSSGVAIFDPGEFKRNPHIPNIVFKDLRIANKLIKPGSERSPLKESLDQTDKLVLNFNQKPISISFAALNLLDAPKNKYLCILEGYDNEWSSPPTPGYVNFENLEPGKYTFRVKASNNDGVWNEVGRSLELRIRPPWWRSALAYLAYASVIFVLFLLYNIYLRQREKQRQAVLLARSEKEKIQAVNKARVQFFTGLAHDFKTPLSLILSPIEQLQNYESQDGKFETLIEIISRNAKRLNSLIAELMTFRKLEMGEIKLEYQQLDIIGFTGEIIREYTHMMESRNINLEINMPVPGFIMSFDPARLARVIYNLLDNAVKYTPDGGSIKISCETPLKKTKGDKNNKNTGYFKIRFFNSGAPFSEEELKRLFERFYQGSGHQEMKYSYGIGLNLVKGLVELHQGHVSVRNIGSKGKEFIIHLPAGAGAETLEVISGTDSEYATGVEYDNIPKQEVFLVSDPNGEIPVEGKKPLVLIVDDNFEFRNYLESSLLEKYNTITAENGSVGLTLAVKKNPDIVVCDIVMPETDGLELCSRIKADIRTSHIPVILLTAKSEIESRLKGLEEGADAYIAKPVNLRHLELQIRNLINTRLLLASKFGGKDPFTLQEGHINKVDSEFLDKAISFVHKNISEDNLNIDLLSEHLFVSRRHLHRKIKALTGSSPVEFINVIRLRKAMELIQEGKLSIAEIGYSVGFSNPSYFANSFKKIYGQPPSFFVK